MLKFSKIMWITVILLLQMSCNSSISTDLTTDVNYTADGQKIINDKKYFIEFNDIPIPDNSTMNIEKTLLLGEKENWIGRLLLNSSLKPDEVFNFYKLNLTKYNWVEITSVRSNISVLTYSLNERIMTIQIAPVKFSTKNSSSINIIMSPKILK